MEQTLMQSEALLLAQKNMLAYFETHDMRYVTNDAVFQNMATGEKYQGRPEIGAMLHYLYQVAFTAKAKVTSYIVTADKAQVEGYFVGRHTGDFAGIPATGNDVHVPLCVTYDLEGGLIKEARIYLLGEVLMQQLGVR